MESDTERAKEPSRTEEGEPSPQHIQEYEFFVNESEGENMDALPADRHAKIAKRRKGGSKNKSITFFLD